MIEFDNYCRQHNITDCNISNISNDILSKSQTTAEELNQIQTTYNAKFKYITVALVVLCVLVTIIIIIIAVVKYKD